MSIPSARLLVVAASQHMALLATAIAPGTVTVRVETLGQFAAACAEGPWQVILACDGVPGLPVTLMLDYLNRSRHRIPVVVARARESGQLAIEVQDCCQVPIDRPEMIAVAIGQMATAMRTARSGSLPQEMQPVQICIKNSISGWPLQAHERLFALIDAIRQSLALEDILVAATSGVRELLGVDRAVVYQFDAEYNGMVVAESVGLGWTVSLGDVISDTCFRETKAVQYAQNRILATDNIYKANLTPCHLQLLERFEVKANLVVPILLDGQVWGLFILHSCSRPRYWLESEIQMLYQIGAQLTIALQQGKLYKASQAQVEELERLARMKDEFLSTASHELRTPVSNIKMAIRMLDRAKDPQQRKSYFKILEDECNREIALIDDLLNLQKLDPFTHPLKIELVPLQLLLAEIMAPFAERMREQNQWLSVQGLNGLKPMHIEKVSLQRILVELLHNACKYTPSGERIRIEFSQDENQFKFVVSNSGVELPCSELPLIFEKFYRISSNDPWRTGGTGLGLALVKGTVHRLGGTICVESARNLTSFTVCLPGNAQMVSLASSISAA